MPEPMTLEESVAFFDGEKTDATGKLREWERAVAGLLAHGRRTVAARSAHADDLPSCACGEQWGGESWHDPKCEVYARFIALTAELAAARQEFAEWLDASRKALDAHAEVVAERDAAREERDVAERALRMHGYRKSCDIPACNCGDQWHHGGTAERRLREVLDENAEIRAERDALAPDELSVMVRVSRDLLPTMGQWCNAVRVMVQHESDGVAHLVFNDQPAQEIETLTADRDRLAACVERVRNLPTTAFRLSMKDEIVACDPADRFAETGAVVLHINLLAALEGTDEAH